jgi:hypothetical protein
MQLLGNGPKSLFCLKGRKTMSFKYTISLGFAALKESQDRPLSPHESPRAFRYWLASILAESQVASLLLDLVKSSAVAVR